ncbi:MAG TPA: hypothetical protein VMW38_08760 [Terriglobia bacterium]|nr:hypothetical protein [Terriglobia bacterium]
MSHGESWGWVTLFLLGVYHGINPGMGWLFAVALGMQEESRRAVWRSLLPIATGHAFAIALVALFGGLLQVVLPLDSLKILVASVLIALGLYRLFRNRHPRWGGMRVGFRDLTIWSFLMASAHGAGLMILPVLLKISEVNSQPLDLPSGQHHHHGVVVGGLSTGLLATAVHTFGYLLITAMLALLVYEKFGLSLLRRAWVNLDLVWAVALMATGCFTFFV